MNLFGRIRSVPTPKVLAVVSVMPSGETRITRWQRGKLTHLGFVKGELWPAALEGVKTHPPRNWRRSFLTAAEAACENYGRGPAAVTPHSAPSGPHPCDMEPA